MYIAVLKLNLAFSNFTNNNEDIIRLDTDSYSEAIKLLKADIIEDVDISSMVIGKVTLYRVEYHEDIPFLEWIERGRRILN